jgi:hypothetical protein
MKPREAPATGGDFLASYGWFEMDTLFVRLEPPIA